MDPHGRRCQLSIIKSMVRVAGPNADGVHDSHLPPWRASGQGQSMELRGYRGQPECRSYSLLEALYDLSGSGPSDCQPDAAGDGLSTQPPQHDAGSGHRNAPCRGTAPAAPRVHAGLARRCGKGGGAGQHATRIRPTPGQSHLAPVHGLPDARVISPWPPTSNAWRSAGPGGKSNRARRPGDQGETTHGVGRVCPRATSSFVDRRPLPRSSLGLRANNSRRGRRGNHEQAFGQRRPPADSAQSNPFCSCTQ